MKEIAELQKQIGTYSKTREVYAQYRKLPQKNRDAFYNEHSSEIILCKVAKRYFDSLGLQKLPSIKALKEEYAVLEAENKKLYPEQKRERAKMMELLTAKSNTDRILGASKNVSQRRVEHGYNASKAALLGLTRGMACSYGRYNITVNAIGPGLFKTEMTENSLFKSDAFLQAYTNQCPMDRTAREGELNGTILYLSSDASSYVTGQFIIVDGGISLV